MSFKSLPVDQRPYKRWAALAIDTVYDPPTDALLVLGTTATSAPDRGTAALVGADNISVLIHFGGGPTEIFPFSVKEFLSAGSTGISPIGLWRD